MFTFAVILLLLLGGSAFFFGSDTLLDDYLAGVSAQQAAELNAFSQTPNPFFGVSNFQHFKIL